MTFEPTVQMVFAPLEVPKWSRAEIHLIDSLVSRRSRPPKANLSGLLLRQVARSRSRHPSRFNSSATIRSAFFSALCRPNSSA